MKKILLVAAKYCILGPRYVSLPQVISTQKGTPPGKTTMSHWKTFAFEKTVIFGGIV